MTLAAGIFLGVALDLTLFDGRDEGDAWTIIEWVVIVIPLAVLFGMPRAPIPGWTSPSGARASRRGIAVILW